MHVAQLLHLRHPHIVSCDRALHLFDILLRTPKHVVERQELAASLFTLRKSCGFALRGCAFEVVSLSDFVCDACVDFGALELVSWLRGEALLTCFGEVCVVCLFERVL